MANADDYAAWIVANADKKGTPEFETVSAAYQQAKGESKPQTSIFKDAALGALKGASDIGTTLLRPIDWATDQITGDANPTMASLITGQKPMTAHEKRVASLKEFFSDNANPDSLAFKGGELAADIAGTAGAGGVVAKGLRMIPAVARVAPALASAVESGGMVAPGANMATRAAGGAINGAATAGMINPEDAGGGAILGAVLPGVAKVGGVVGDTIGKGLDWAAEKSMQSALKPTIQQLRSGDAAVAVRTLLDNGINVTKGGAEKLRGMIDDLNQQISGAISSSPATVNRQSVLQALDDTRKAFASQVSPTADLSAIDAVAQDFANHPALAAAADIPVQTAQELKQGTYRVLAKKYGQLGSAETEAQKAIARGLKEEIAKAVPDVAPLNAQESALIRALGVTDRRALMDMNKNPVGLTALASNPVGAAAFMADRSALFKSLAARAVNSASQPVKNSNVLLEKLLANPEVRAALITSETGP